MTIADEIKLLTTHQGARRLTEIADQIQEQVNRCCDCGSDLRPAAPIPSPTPPAPATEPNKP